MAGKTTPLFSAILILAILVMVNLLSARFSFRMDFTEERQYTLSSATEQLLTNLEDPVTVKAYFSEDLPPDFLRARQQFKDLLVEYSARSNGRLVYEFIDPVEDADVEEKVIAQGVQPVMIEVRERDQKKQQKAYLSAVVEMNEEQETIPFLRPGGSMEYLLSSAIKKLTLTEKSTIGYIQGHGEPPLTELIQARAELEVMYNLEPYYIAGGTVPGPDRFAAMIWLRPTDTIPPDHLQFIDDYLAQGGRMMVAYNPVEGDFVDMIADKIYTGLTPWLAEKGLNVQQNLVIDNRSGSVAVQQNEGMFAYTNNVTFPFLPLLRGVEDNMISGGLEAVMLEFPSEITFGGDTALQFEPVLKTSSQSDTWDPPRVLEIQRQWRAADFPRSDIVVGATLSGRISGDVLTRMVVFTDGDFPVNGPREQARQLQADNVSLFVNGVDWLVDDTGLIELRTRGAVVRPLDPLEDQTKMLLKYGNFLAPILLVFIYGIIRSQHRRALRKRRMQEDYTA